MLLILKYISQELISKLQLRIGLPISHFKMYIAKKDLKTSTPEWVAHISCDVDFEIYIAGIDLKTSISDWIAHIS